MAETGGTDVSAPCEVGTYSHLHSEVLSILGPCHFTLDQSFRLRLDCFLEALEDTQNGAIISTVILIPLNYTEGRQVYYFRSPHYRLCKAAMRTFDEFKEMLQAIVHAYKQLISDMSQLQTKTMCASSTGGAGGKTPLGRLQSSSSKSSGNSSSSSIHLSHAWNLMHGCSQSTMRLLERMQTTPQLPENGIFSPPLWWLPEDLLFDPDMHLTLAMSGQNIFTATATHDDLSLIGFFGLWGGNAMSPTVAQESSSIFDTFGIENVHETFAQQALSTGHRTEVPGLGASSIAVGGLVGAIFGFFEGMCWKVAIQDRRSAADSLRSKLRSVVLERAALRGLVGIAVSALCFWLGRLLRLRLSSNQYARLIKKLNRNVIPASQAIVFVATAARTALKFRPYVEPAFWSRCVWQRDLNLAERQATGIILTSGVASLFSASGYFLGARIVGVSLGGPAGAFAGSLMPMVITLLLSGLDWWHDRTRRKQMKTAALQTLGLPDPVGLGMGVFRSMLSARYKLVVCYLHPDKNDSGRCDTIPLFNQIRLAKEILEQELRDYQHCPRERFRRLFKQMLALSGYRQERFVSAFPRGVVMQILAEESLSASPDGAVPWIAQTSEHSEYTTSTDSDSLTTDESRFINDSIATIESRSLASSAPTPTGVLTPRHHQEVGILSLAVESESLCLQQRLSNDASRDEVAGFADEALHGTQESGASVAGWELVSEVDDAPGKHRSDSPAVDTSRADA